MKKIKKLFQKNKKEGELLFQIRRHIFDPNVGGRKRKKRASFMRFIGRVAKLHVTVAQLRKFLIGCMVLIAGVGVVLFSQLSIEEIHITRENSLIDINEAYRSLGYMRGRNILSVQKDQIIERLQSSQSVIRTASITRRFPNQLYVHIVPYTPLFQTNLGYIMDSGYLFDIIVGQSQDIPWIDII
ncbi:FtsQ-type POTRA domain-containing protein, partial [Candidatus Gracilibacteria bacterium]|nr:FtsQ-type POTRA domain-containing protein [Candidatus Gracilibacteria bacterium]